MHVLPRVQTENREESSLNRESKHVRNMGSQSKTVSDMPEKHVAPNEGWPLTVEAMSSILKAIGTVSTLGFLRFLRVSDMHSWVLEGMEERLRQEVELSVLVVIDSYTMHMQQNYMLFSYPNVTPSLIDGLQSQDIHPNSFFSEGL